MGERDVGQQNEVDSPKSRPGERLVKGLQSDGTVDGTYWSPSLAKEDGLAEMSSEQRQEYNKILDELGKTVPLEVEEQENEGDNGWGKRLIAAATVGALLGGAGVALSPPTMANAETSVQKSQVTVGEVTPEITPSYKSETNKEIMSFETPVPTEKIKFIVEDWKQETYGPYENELRELGAKDEGWIKWGGRVLNAYDRHLDINYNVSGDMFQNYITRDEIVKYVLDGKGERVFCDEKGDPLCLTIVPDQGDEKTTTQFEKKVIKGFKDAISWYKKNGASDVIDSLKNNGFCVFFPVLSHSESMVGSVYLTDFGVIAPNMNFENSKMIRDFKNTFIANLFVESYGIAFFQEMKALDLNNDLGGGIYVGGYMEWIKSLVSVCVAKDLNNVKKNDIYKLLVEHFSFNSDYFYNLYLQQYDITLDKSTASRLLDVLAVMVDPIGFNSLYDLSTFSQTMESVKQ